MYFLPDPPLLSVLLKEVLVWNTGGELLVDFLNIGTVLAFTKIRRFS